MRVALPDRMPSELRKMLDARMAGGSQVDLERQCDAWLADGGRYRIEREARLPDTADAAEQERRREINTRRQRRWEVAVGVAWRALLRASEDRDAVRFDMWTTILAESGINVARAEWQREHDSRDHFGRRRCLPHRCAPCSVEECVPS